MSDGTILIDAAWAPAKDQRAMGLARMAVLALAGSMLIAVCAHLRVPMWPVPVTMQTFAVLLIGMTYGARLGAATVLLYLVEGALGFPVFTNGGGLVQFAGPTGGYLVGYVVAAALAGGLAQLGWSRPAFRIMLAMLLGSAVIYLFGAAWLSTIVGPEKAWTLGVLPFLLGDAVKAALAALLLPVAWRTLPGQR